MDTLKKDCSILLLAGGQGSRMGGRDKGLVPWLGRPLIAHLHQVVRPLTDDLIISCNRNQSRYAAYADQLVGDDEAGFPGPLAGVLAGLRKARHPWTLLLPCDAPNVNRQLLQPLLEGRADAARRPLMVRQGKQWQPMFSLLPDCLLPELEAAWRRGERSLLRILLAAGAQAFDRAEDDPRLQNFNTPQHLDARPCPAPQAS
ncbi:molybdenum cofactor guanylyltransferase MobA [Pseudomonas sp. BN417]|uniref:molybdenum cofactor guanylyltransferase MobA n=1 Tax=Pseudomonas sp. BN417 TaxID=2567890 RepID=UPI002456AEDB|nr:molybdenum cofactor guanylyltransferase MobA [Pseudomonas sp. BN417]MDH4556926.1 molybdenum cofactor guanylyltransferase MobA [Pseudomonas sp. BN417]